jgi:hypothetical protein
VLDGQSVERSKILMASSMKMKVFWDIAPCSLAGVDRRFSRAYCVHNQGYDRYIPEDSYLRTQSSLQVSWFNK